jgi:uncharacterized membrane protein SirB2
MPQSADSFTINFRLIIFATIAILINIGGFFYGQDRGGWADIGLLIFAAPVYNIAILIAGIIFITSTSRKHPDVNLGFYWMAVILLPVLLYIATAVFTLALAKGGC